MKIALITPDRGDRPEFLDHCRFQMKRQTLNATHFVIDDPPVPGVVDIVPRIKKGIQLAQDGGFDYCFIIENDDYYPDTYLERMVMHFRSTTALLGVENSIYYSLQMRNWRVLTHPGRASLFCTAFKMAGIKKFVWPPDDMLYFDRNLWDKMPGEKRLCHLSHPPIGMKHGVGFCPGNYHNNTCNGSAPGHMIDDHDMHWLRKRIRPESYEFYRHYSEKLNIT